MEPSVEPIFPKIFKIPAVIFEKSRKIGKFHQCGTKVDFVEPNTFGVEPKKNIVCVEPENNYAKTYWETETTN